MAEVGAESEWFKISIMFSKILYDDASRREFSSPRVSKHFKSNSFQMDLRLDYEYYQ